jgi:hypothetical protein
MVRLAGDDGYLTRLSYCRVPYSFRILTGHASDRAKALVTKPLGSPSSAKRLQCSAIVEVFEEASFGTFVFPALRKSIRRKWARLL